MYIYRVVTISAIAHQMQRSQVLPMYPHIILILLYYSIIWGIIGIQKHIGNYAGIIGKNLQTSENNRLVLNPSESHQQRSSLEDVSVMLQYNRK